MAIDGQLAAVICIEDPLREEAADVNQTASQSWTYQACYDDW